MLALNRIAVSQSEAHQGHYISMKELGNCILYRNIFFFKIEQVLFAYLSYIAESIISMVKQRSFKENLVTSLTL